MLHAKQKLIYFRFEEYHDVKMTPYLPEIVAKNIREEPEESPLRAISPQKAVKKRALPCLSCDEV